LDRGKKLEEDWNRQLDQYREADAGLARKWDDCINGRLPEGWDSDIPVFSPDEKGKATRVVSGQVLNAIAGKVLNLMGGSADLAPSNKTMISKEKNFQHTDYTQRNIHFGIREHAMGGILNGMSLHGGIIPYGGTFLIFSDYMRPSIRLAALMGIKVIYVLTHDSIGLGEDGPTHQPVEQLASLRAMPGLTVLRPADANETAEAWKLAMDSDSGPVVLALTRQSIPTLDRSQVAPAERFSKGAYVLWQSGEGIPDVILIGTGSEVQTAMDAGRELASEGTNVRVVSMPSWELFERQSEEYRDDVLPSQVTARISVEAGVTMGWERYVGRRGRAIGIETFGASAPAGVLFEKYGITADNVIIKAKELLKGG